MGLADEKNIRIGKWIRYSILGCSICYTIIFFLFHMFGEPPKPRQTHFLKTKEVAEAFDNQFDAIERSFDSRLIYYKEKVSALKTTMAITGALCILGIVVIFYRETIEIPTLNIKIPSKLTYLVVATSLSFYWLQFGFLLHHIIETRVSLIGLINAQYVINHPNQISQNGNILIPTYQYFYSVTRANDLKDTGFVDAWFLTFLEEQFPTAKLSFMDSMVPITGLSGMALIFGISQGLQLALPLIWYIKFGNFKRNLTIVSLLILVTNIFFITTSHLSFYYSGRNPNWLQFIILLTCILVFGFVTSDMKKLSYDKDK